MGEAYTKYTNFEKKIWIIGFGSIGQAVLPLLLRHIKITPEQIAIINKKDDGESLAKQYNVAYEVQQLTPENYESILNSRIQSGDFLLNLSVDVSSFDLIQWCQANNVCYLDTCIEPWAGGYTDQQLTVARRSNYSMREEVLDFKKKKALKPTAVLTHGANPGLVSHFVKQALMTIAADNGYTLTKPTNKKEWAALAHQLNIKAIHIAERDTQRTSVPKRTNEFVNTWSVDGFISEGSQPAELGWGTHERQLPEDGSHHQTGSKCAIYLHRPSAATKVRTWTPLAGPFHGFLITHSEAMSIADYLTLKEGDTVIYRPTVHYAYHPCEAAVLSLHEFAGREWQQQTNQRIIFDDIIDGIDENGVLLMGNKRGAYWFGSQLSIEEARSLVPHNNATTLQVAAGVLAGVVWAMQHPNEGIVEPDDIDDEFVINIARPYLGRLVGNYTDWTPIKERANLFPESIDQEDPWQFSNIRVE